MGTDRGAQDFILSVPAGHPSHAKFTMGRLLHNAYGLQEIVHVGVDGKLANSARLPHRLLDFHHGGRIQWGRALSYVDSAFPRCNQHKAVSKNRQPALTSSLRAQGHHRVDCRRAARGEKTREEGDGGKDEGDQHEGERVGWAGVIEHSTEQPRQTEGAGQTEDQADQ